MFLYTKTTLSINITGAQAPVVGNLASPLDVITNK